MEEVALPDFQALEGIRADLLRTETLRDSATQRLQALEIEVVRLEGESEILSRVADLFRAMIDQEVISNAETAQDLLTEGLKAVFDDLDLAVKAVVEIQRGKVSVDLVTVQRHPNGTTTEGAPTEAYGGSLATVQSVLLRIVVLSRRGLRPVLLLDESLGAVAEDYVPRVGRFLAVLCERMNLDVLAVSHNPVLVEAATTAYRIRKSGGEATLNPIRAGKP